MKKNSSKEAFVKRMQKLANVNESVNNKSIGIGTLIDYKRGTDKIAYGIIKENHHYYIKKSNSQKEKPLAEDFAYIGGLENITEYRYDKLSEADKNRNMLLMTIDEAYGSKNPIITESRKKQMLTEGAEEEIAAAEEKMEDAEEMAAEEPVNEPAPEENLPTDEPLEDVPMEKPTPEENPEVDVDIDNIELPDEETPTEEPEGEPTPEEETPAEEPEGEPAPEEDEDDENNREIRKLVGKIGNLARNSESTPTQVKSYINSILSAFEDEIPNLEIEDRKDMSDQIMKVVDSDAEMADTDIEGEEKAAEIEETEKSCDQCGFAKYVSERGYNSESIMECGTDEMANLMSGYIMNKDGEMTDDDYEDMSSFTSPEIEETLKEEYGHEDISECMQPYTEKLNEEQASPEAKKKKIEGMFWWETKPQDKKDTTLKTLSEEELEKYSEMGDEELEGLDENTLNELNLAGLKNVGSFLGKKAGGAVKGAAQGIANAVTNKIDQATQKLDQLGNEIAQQYQKGVKSTVEAKLQKAAQEFGELVNKLDAASQKAGDGALNKQQLLMQLQGILKGASSIKEAVGQVDNANIQTQPNLNEDEEEGEDGVELEMGAEEIPEEEPVVPEPEITTGFETMGGGVVKPESPDNKTVDVEVNKDAGTVNVSMNESEKKMRKYIRNRLMEMTGQKKSTINEDKKSENLKKLDKLIMEQYKDVLDKMSKKKK